MQPQRRHGLAPVLVGSAVTVAFTAILLARSLGDGIILYRDFVSVPDPVGGARAWGWDGPAPRAVPLDGVTALFAPVVPTGVQQQAMLLATLLLSGIGVTVLLRRRGALAVGVAAALATWNPYAAERLLLGQPPTLLAWSALPWLCIAMRSPVNGWRRPARVALAAAPAALTPFGGLAAAAVVIGLLVLDRDRGRFRPRDDAAVVGVALLWCLPWLLPALARRTGAGPASGAQAFRLRLDTPMDLLDVLGGGGVWSTAATLESREQALGVLVSGAVLLVALVGLRAVRRRRLALAALLGPPVLAMLLATGPGVAAFGWAQRVPGVAILRDTHRWLGLSWFAASVLAGLGAAVLAGLGATGPARRHTPASSSVLTGHPAAGLPGEAGWPGPDRRGHRPSAGRPRGPAARPWLGGAVPAALGLALVAAAPLTAPDAPHRLAAAYHPVHFPAGWRCTLAAVGDRAVLVLPWQPMRATDWARGQVFLDPLPLAVRGAVWSAHDLIVLRDGAVLRVGSSDPPQSRRWADGVVDAAELRRSGIDRVVEWRGTPGRLPSSHAGLALVRGDADFRVWSVGPPGPGADRRLPDGCG